MDLFEAVVVSELLSSSTARRVLMSTAERSSDPADRRRLRNPVEFATRVRKHADALGSDLTRAERVSEEYLRVSAEQGFDALLFGDDDYPERLAQIADSPPVLWIVGARDVLRSTTVALIGSRAGSAYACEVAEMLASGLSARGVTVVSGLARGVDGAAHRGGLLGPGGTIAVLGCGLDVAYPPEHRDLMHRIRARGAVVSKFGPSVPPQRCNFPRRTGSSAGSLLRSSSSRLRRGVVPSSRPAAQLNRDAT